MNKIIKLFDPDFVRHLFRQEILFLYPEALDIGQIKIKPYKKLIWETTYHVVLDFLVEFKLKGGASRKTHIVCTAHSSEARDIAFAVLKYLRGCRLGGNIALPRPLFYSPEFRGYFYRALSGKNLLHFISIKDKESIHSLVEKSALLFARLHAIKINQPLPDFYPNNQRIATVIPGIENINKEISVRYGPEMIKKIIHPYRDCIKIEDAWLATNTKRCLIHGDAHAENIIRVSKNKIGLVDFTDFTLGDFTRDLGTFLQQLGYKLELRLGDKIFSTTMKKLFLNCYLQASGQELNDNLQNRLNNYYLWTALRTATYWLLKDRSNPNRADFIFQQIDQMRNKQSKAQE